MYGADALGAEGTLDNNFRLRKRRACATYGNRAAKWTTGNLSETLYFNTMWTWHIDKGLSQEQQGQYSKHIYLGETRIVTKQTSDLEEHYGQSEELRHQYYYHPDHLGSAQLVTDYEGNEYQRIEYTPYGELWVEKKTAHEKDMRYLPYKFTAKEQDEETGLYYYGARYLDAKYSRWLSADPAVSDYIPLAPVDDEAKKHNQQLPGMGGIYNSVNLHLYHYANNNPIHYSDPDGNFAWTASMWWLPAIDGPIPVGDIIYGIGITIEFINLACFANRTCDIAISQSQTRTNEQPNRLVIQIQNCSKGNSQETLGTSETQFGDPRIGVTKAQALGALELASADLANTNKSMVMSPEFQNAKKELQAKILASGPQFDVMKKNALQATFEYNGTKYRIDVDSYVPKGNAPNLME